MSIMDGIEAMKVLHERHPDINVLVLSSFQDHESVYANLRNSAVGSVTKSSLTEDDLADTIRAHSRGKMVFSKDIVEQLMSPPQPSMDFHLTDRELEVLLLAESLTNQQSVLKLSISQSTLMFHMTNFNRKLGVQTRSEALVLAAKNNLI